MLLAAPHGGPAIEPSLPRSLLVLVTGLSLSELKHSQRGRIWPVSIDEEHINDLKVQQNIAEVIKTCSQFGLPGRGLDQSFA